MNLRKTRNRKSSTTLTGTRIYILDGRYKYRSPEPMLNPKTGKVLTLHTLCPVSEGEYKARETLNTLVAKANPKGRVTSVRGLINGVRNY